VRYRKTEKIELNREYPCPCKRKGVLIPIVLTDALGCDRCQEIFVVTGNGYTIEPVSSTSPYKRAWSWTGKKWQDACRPCLEMYSPLTIFVVIGLLIIWIPLIIRFAVNAKIVFGLTITLILAILLALFVWRRYRR
jgi:hypothetical protein